MAENNRSQQHSLKSLEEIYQVYFVKDKITKNIKEEILLIKQAKERIKKQYENHKENNERKQQSSPGHINSERTTKIATGIHNNSIKVSNSRRDESTDNSPATITYWKCQHCLLYNREKVYVCTGCSKINEQIKKKIENQWSCSHCTTINLNDNYICQMCSKSNAKMKAKIGNVKGAVSKSKNPFESTCPSHIADDEIGDPYYPITYNHNPKEESFKNVQDVQNVFDTPIKKTETDEDSLVLNSSLETDKYQTAQRIAEIQENVGQLVDSATTKGGFMSIIKNTISILTGSKNQKVQKIEKTFKEIIESNSWETLDEEIKKIYRRLVAKGLSDEDINGYHLAILKYIMPEIEDHFVIYMYKENNFKIEATLKELLQVMTLS